MKKVPKDRLRVVEPDQAMQEQRQLALPLREIAGVIREGLLALSVTAGMAVLEQMLQQLERTRLAERHEAAKRNPARATLATITARSITRLEGEMARLQEIADQLRRRGAGPA